VNSDTNQERQNRSIGMDNINSRLEAIYANRYNLSYAMSDGRFKTHITIPFELAKVS
jgi:LytS/YehU family sensor histidine kinase